jgi:hypothetical protein
MQMPIRLSLIDRPRIRVPRVTKAEATTNERASACRIQDICSKKHHDSHTRSERTARDGA